MAFRKVEITFTFLVKPLPGIYEIVFVYVGMGAGLLPVQLRSELADVT